MLSYGTLNEEMREKMEAKTFARITTYAESCATACSVINRPYWISHGLPSLPVKLVLWVLKGIINAGEISNISVFSWIQRTRKKGWAGENKHRHSGKFSLAEVFLGRRNCEVTQTVACCWKTRLFKPESCFLFIPSSLPVTLYPLYLLR